MNKPSTASSGFSLVEVALALGVAAFCLITLLALIPVGVKHYQQGDTQDAMVSLATMVTRDLQATASSSSTVSSPRFGFPVPAASGASGTLCTIYVDPSGTATATAVNAPPTSASIYRVSVQFYPPSGVTMKTATLARLMVTFPALADAAPTTSPTNYSNIFETTIALNRN